MIWQGLERKGTLRFDGGVTTPSNGHHAHREFPWKASSKTSSSTRLDFSTSPPNLETYPNPARDGIFAGYIRRKPNLKSRIEEATEAVVTGFAIDFPAHGPVWASNDLRRQGVFGSPEGGLVLTQLRCRPWSAKNKTTRPAAGSKPILPDISAAKASFTSAPSRERCAFTSKPLWTPTLSGPLASCTRPRRHHRC